MTILISLSLLNIGAFSLSRLAKIESTVAYLAVLMASLDIIYFGALADKLKFATAFCFACMLGIFAVYLLKTKGKKLYKDLGKYCNVHTLLHTASSIIYYIILLNKKPTLYYWDEIRIWGPSAKSVKLFDKLYSIGINPNLHDRNYPPGSALLNYLFSFFTNKFSEVLLLTSYAIMFFAVFSAVAKVVEIKTKNKALSIGTYFAFMLLPFLQNYHYIDTAGYTSISYAYGTSMVDFNVAVVFLAVIVMYFFNMNKFWYVLPAIYLITVKKNGIFFVLLAFCVIFCFEICTNGFKLNNMKKLTATVLAALIMPASAYLAWNKHLEFYDIQRAEAEYQLNYSDHYSQQQTTQMSEEITAVQTSSSSSKVSKFINNLKSQRFKEILAEMKVYFSEFQEIVYIKDKYLIIILLLSGVVTALLADKKYMLPLGLTSVGLTLACFVYNLCISYQMQFYNDQMVEYPRYMVSYYYGWLYVILLIVLIFTSKRLLIKKTITYAIALFSMWYINYIGIDRTIIDAPNDVYYEYMNLFQRVADVNKILKENDRVLLVWMDGYDDIFYSYAYYLLPGVCNVDTQGTNIDFSINFRNPDVYLGEKTYFNFATKEQFTELLKEYFDYVYICNEYDQDFELSYGSLFENGIERDTLYKVTSTDIPLQKVVYNES